MVEKDVLISFFAVTCLKLVFLPLYKSTDFEVHRNWMAITFQKELKEWYYESTSEWTLDYPPLFAWFEYLLAQVAWYFDSKMLDVSNLNYSSPQTVFYMRLSVILSDIVYLYGVYRVCKLCKSTKKMDDPWKRREIILAMLLLWNPGLLMVDHIHFQYNGFLTGIFFISLANMFEEKYLWGAVWFSALINFKHIYLYIAPAYFLFLLKNHCFQKSTSVHAFSFLKFLNLSVVTILPFLVSLGPFIYMGQTKQLLSRLFPVKRGLTHSYWAPNIWALYNFLDRILGFVGSHLNLIVRSESCLTRGLVQECENAILPNVSSLTTVLLALASFSPAVWLIYTKPATPKVFLTSIMMCSFGSFMFGYHVHEKAILMVLLPMAIAAVMWADISSIYVFISVVGHYSLFPLLYQEGETLLKVELLILHLVYSVSCLTELHHLKSLLSPLQKVYLGGFIPIQIFYSFGDKLLGFEGKFPFLPLMLISTYCAIGVFYSWVKCLSIMIQNKFEFKKSL